MENRQFMVYTGTNGYLQYNNALELEVNTLLADSLYRRELIDHNEYITILSMIRSNDERDNIMGKTILETKDKQYVSSI